MTEGPDVLAPVDPETWIERFVRRVSTQELDIAFVTPSGHVMSWAQFRFVYPRYRDVDAEWQPPTESLDALVLHFGGYEVAIPVAQLDLEFPISAFANEHHRLTRAWHEAHPDHTVALPMDVRIMTERMAAVHSKIEVVIATCAYDRETLQDILTIPGVRLERSRARLSEVSYALVDEEPSPDVLDIREGRILADVEMQRTSWELHKREFDTEKVADIEWDRMTRRLGIFKHASAYPRLKASYEAVPSDFWNHPDAFREIMFIEAVRRRATTRELLRLAHMLIFNEDKEPSRPRDFAYMRWAFVAAGLGQHRTAWCLGIRAFDGLWRDGSVFFEPEGSGRRSYSLQRTEYIRFLAKLVERSKHPYWSRIFSLWSLDYEAAIHATPRKNKKQPTAETRVEPESMMEQGEAEFIAHVRASRRLLNDESE